MSAYYAKRILIFILGVSLLTLLGSWHHISRADGLVRALQKYSGSLEESAQEAIIIYNTGPLPEGGTESLILKIHVQKGKDDKEALKSFGWVVPFPTQPTTHKEDPKLFKEIFSYVQHRKRQQRPSSKENHKPLGVKSAEERVTILSRKTVGSYDVAMIKEEEAGGLNAWLEKEGFQVLGPEAEDVIGFYRKKGYVFACMKVSEVSLEDTNPVELHPLRFTFKTGGRDGIYFPMKLTGLQEKPFDVNLYVFYQAWLNEKQNQFGFVHRGFKLIHRDWDTPNCEANAGKAYSAPKTDPYLKDSLHRLTTVTRLFQKLHPGSRYYLTNIQANGLRPGEVRDWSDDLWLFPFYSDTSFVPHDVREDGPASTGWPDVQMKQATDPIDGPETEIPSPISTFILSAAIVIVGLLVFFMFKKGATR